MNEEVVTYIDLFSGAGGLSLGLEKIGFKNLFAVEFNDSAASTYKKNFPKNKLIVDDIKKLSNEQAKELTENTSVDLIVGGPPCQGFSIAGNIGRKFIDDPRNHLFLEFVRIVHALKPRMFIMENVARMATHNRGKTIREIVSKFEEVGYKVDYRVLNAVNFEVPQNRRRIFIVGRRNDLDLTFAFPTPIPTIHTVGEVIEDLPPLSNGESSDIPNYFAMNHTKQMLDKMSYVKEGGNREDIPINLRPKSGDARKYIRYDRNKPSVTITGDMRKVFHYEQNRALTPRELARIQTFPDSFIFEGNSISQQQQIGNAVPPKLAEEVGKSALYSLKNQDSKHSFPKVNYIGNKKNLTDWIIDNIPKGVNTILDLFAGGSSISYAMKKAGYKVYSNDVLYSSYVINKALIENQHTILPPDTITKAMQYQITSDDDNKVSWLANKLYFSDEIEELARLVGYSDMLEGYVKDMYLALLRRAMIRKLPYSRMNLTWKNIKLLRDENYSYEKYGRKRAYHNQSFSYHMGKDLESYNKAVFDNKKENNTTQLNATDAINMYDDLDMVYMDPPYPGTMNNYDGFYGVYDEIFNRKLEHNDLTNSKNFLSKLENLISLSADRSKYLLLSINSQTKPNYKDIINMCSFYGDVELKHKKHNYKVSGKEMKNKNEELLIKVTFYK